MKQFPIVGLFVLMALCGCRTSDRTITLEHSWITVEPHRFESGFLAITYSTDGELMAGLSEAEDSFEVRDVDTGSLVGSFPDLTTGWWPALFSPDNESLILVCSGKKVCESAVVPVTGTDTEPVVHARVSIDAVVEDESNESFGVNNYDSTLHALTNGVVLFRDGSLVAVAGAEGQPFFDQYGAVWYRSRSGWSSVGRDKSVTKGVDRPGYLVANQTVHRGSMHLLIDATTLERNDAEAYVTAVWLDHDKAVEMHDDESDELMLDRTALVYVGADVYWFVFVPNRKIVAITTNEGTAFVPYVVKPRGKADE
ncbi:MAG: hypothetical protein IH944_01945 [Armatimonadetes bacterium]|nr:hypothetical protein [Armatimonadota bacterium]